MEGTFGTIARCVVVVLAPAISAAVTTIIGHWQQGPKVKATRTEVKTCNGGTIGLIGKDRTSPRPAHSGPRRQRVPAVLRTPQPHEGRPLQQQMLDKHYSSCNSSDEIVKYRRSASF